MRRRLDASGAGPRRCRPRRRAGGAGRARVAAVEPPVDDTPVARNRGDAPAGRARVSGPDARPVGRAEHPDDDEPAYAREAPEPPAAAGTYGGDRPAATAYGSARPREHDRPEAAHRPGGVVRHTETVHVTTRHTGWTAARPSRPGATAAGRRSVDPHPRRSGPGAATPTAPSPGRPGEERAGQHPEPGTARAGLDGPPRRTGVDGSARRLRPARRARPGGPVTAPESRRRSPGTALTRGWSERARPGRRPGTAGRTAAAGRRHRRVLVAAAGR